jgi:hypothetical protein
MINMILFDISVRFWYKYSWLSNYSHIINNEKVWMVRWSLSYCITVRLKKAWTCFCYNTGKSLTWISLKFSVIPYTWRKTKSSCRWSRNWSIWTTTCLLTSDKKVIYRIVWTYDRKQHWWILDVLNQHAQYNLSFGSQLMPKKSES